MSKAKRGTQSDRRTPHQRSAKPLASLLAVTCCLAGLVCRLHGADSARTNILLIISDDLGARVGCYGAPVKTPNIDALAGRGVRFDRAYVQYPICNPSRSSFLTGLRPEQTKVLDNGTSFRRQLQDVVTLPQRFRQAGWFTAGYGKIFHSGGAGNKERALWIDADRSWDDAHEANFERKPRLIAGRNLSDGKLGWCRWGATEGPDENEADYGTGSAAIAAIDKAGDKSWFIAAGFHRPHDPYVCPQKYFNLYPVESLQLHRDPKDMTPVSKVSMPVNETSGIFKAFTDQERLEFLRAYYACASFMDAQVGRLLRELERRKLNEKTLVIFIGDNGFHLGEREHWNKGTLFEQSCRVPFIVAGPGVPVGQVARSPIELVDLYPTLLDLCGLKAPHRLAGESIKPLLENPAVAGKGYAFTMVTRGNLLGRTVRTDRWRYTEWDQGRQGVELYDETADPGENCNLSTRPELAQTIASLKALFDRHLPK